MFKIVSVNGVACQRGFLKGIVFSLQEDAGGGLVFWHPKGSKIRRIIEDFWKDAHTDGGYEMVY